MSSTDSFVTAHGGSIPDRQIRRSISIRPMSFRNQFQQTRRKEQLFNRLLMSLVTLSVLFYAVLSPIIGFQCGKRTDEQEEHSLKMWKKLFPIVMTISIVYTLFFLYSMIVIYQINRNDDWMGILIVGIWCQISILLLWIKQYEITNSRCYHIAIMYISWILFFFMFYSFFKKK
jgi:hypothetical protein